MTGRWHPGRLPIRVRLVAGFSLAMLVLLTAAGSFVFWRVEFALDRSLEREVSRATTALAPLVRDGKVTDDNAVASAGVTYQVLDRDGGLLSGSSGRRVVSVEEARAAATDPVAVDVGSLLPPSDRPMRGLLTRLGGGSHDLLLVAVPRDQRDEALRELLLQLGLTGLVTLLVTSAIGYRLAGAALAPVERYRRQAAEIASGATGVRLDVPVERSDEVTRLGATLNQMLAALEGAVEAERRFVEDASHELRTPITLLRSRVQLARRRERSVADHEEVLGELEADIGRLGTLAERLLELGTTTPLAPRPAVDLVPSLARLVERRRVLDPDLDVELATVAGPVLVGHGDDLDRVVENLVDNAARHGRPPIAIELHVKDTWARVVVSDAGAGMDEEMLGRAPERFARSAEARGRPGSGLGLSLVLALVVEAGGELRLCAAGRHESFGRAVDWECAHDDRMTVSVLVPRV